MISSARKKITIIISFVACLPVATLVYSELNTLSRIIRLAAAVGVAGNLTFGFICISLYYRIGKFTKIGLAACSVIAGFLLVSNADRSGMYISALTVRHAPDSRDHDYVGALIALGHLFIVAFAILIGLLVLTRIAKKSLDVLRNLSWTEVAERTPLLIPFLLMVGIAYWNASHSSYIFFWDFRNYWEKTEILFELIRSKLWQPMIWIVAERYAADYSMFPAVLPAVASQLIGYPTRTVYLLVIIVLYAVPAYASVAYLGHRILLMRLSGSHGVVLKVLSILVPLFGVPLFLSTSLNMMLDIGGVPLFVIALLCAREMLDLIISETEDSIVARDDDRFIYVSLAFGLTLSALFLYRRWYVFAGAGIVIAEFILLSRYMFLQKGRFLPLLKRSIFGLLLVGFSVLPFMAWVAFDWSHSLAQHDYSALYASYKASATFMAQAFLRLVGLLVPVCCALFLFLAVNRPSDRKLLALTVISTFSAVVLFLRVQDPGIHHYYLLMPLLGASLSGLSLILATSSHKKIWANSACGLIIGITAAASANPTSWMSERLFPGYVGWKPKQQPYGAGITRVAEWLVKAENLPLKFCVVASGNTLNSGVIAQSWQIDSNIPKGAFDRRFIQLGEVDSRDGPPSRKIEECALFLIALPFQTHLGAKEQYTLKVLLDALVSGSGIGQAYSRAPTVFQLGNNVKILGFRRERAITNAEYNGLVNRYLAHKQNDQNDSVSRN